MAVLITGGSGFIGRNLVEQLSERWEILAPSHSQLDLLDDVGVRRFVRSHPVDAIVHCATKPGHRNAKDPTGLLDANTRMFFNLAGCTGESTRFIFLSTGAVYDIRHYKPRMPEEYFDKHVPQDETGYSKYICAKYLAKMPNAVELRPFGVFGKHEDWEIRFISNAICKVLHHLPVTIKRNRRMDYVYIDDLVRVVEHFLTATPSRSAYNVTSDETYELLDLARRVAAIAEDHPPIKILASGMDPEYSGDNARLHEELPGLAFTPIDAAIRELYDWYAGRKSLVDPELLLHDK
ncbi:MAG TPA: NAD(P)-dependent oxidoreductase [Chloroflexota bacterium]|nr:NAD(P)-dependent oxidoreductase [Chloroflexota bacterium]